LDAKLTTLLCKKKSVAQSREVNIEWANSTQIWQNLLREAMALKGCFANDDDDDTMTIL
jgi:hypothetical protein